MNIWLGVTDYEWYNYLAQIPANEVNFWQPSGNTSFKVLKRGELFLFKLKHPHNAIGGGGFFVSQTTLPLSVAWDTFKEQNGTDNFTDFRKKIWTYKRSSSEVNPNIGCIVLTDTFFFNPDIWVPQPSDWGKSIVQGKSYSIDSASGLEIWNQVQARLQFPTTELNSGVTNSQHITDEQAARYGYGVAAYRLGQTSFRVLVTEAYEKRCAFTGERTLPVLTAAHIKAYAKSGPHYVSNGLLMRSDIHTLFDQGYVTITPDYRVEVSKRIKEEYNNGVEYYKLHGNQIRLPNNPNDHPSDEYINWHNQNVFEA